MKSLSLEPTSSVSSGGGGGGRHHQQQGNHHSHQPSQQQTHHGNVAVTELNHFQVERLRAVLSDPVEIHGRENFPTLEIQLYRLIAHVKRWVVVKVVDVSAYVTRHIDFRKLHEAGIQLNNVKMNGGAAR
jgi:Nucleotidyltransferase